MLDVVNFTSAMQAFAEATSGASPLEVPIEDLANLLDIDNEVDRFRELYAAIARRCAIYLDYAAKRGRIQLIFSPHAVVRTPTRPSLPRTFHQTLRGQQPLHRRGAGADHLIEPRIR